MALEPAEIEEFTAFAEKYASDAATLEEALSRYRQRSASWHPRTQLGNRLKELREKFIAEGGKLLTIDEVDAEVRERRGETFCGD